MARLFLFKLFLIFLIASPAYADDSPRLLTYPPQKIMGFRGLDTTSRAPVTQDGRAIDIDNVKLSIAFDAKQRFGYAVIRDTLDDRTLSSEPIVGIFDSQFSDNSSKILAFLGDTVKYDTGSIWTGVPKAANVTITSGQDNLWLCIMALDNAICSNDVDKLVKINKDPFGDLLNITGLTDTLTKAKALAWFRNFLILGNTVEASIERPTRFRWSNIGTIETFSNDDFNDITALGGDEIIAMKELYGNLYVFLRRSIWRVSFVAGDDVFTFSKIVDGIGAVSTHSVQIVRLPNNQLAIAFMSEEKRIYLFNGLSLADIGVIIQPTLDSLNADDSRLDKSVGIFDGNSYFLSVSSENATKHDILLEYQLQIGEWTKHSQIDANALARVKEADALVKTYFGNYNAFVYWLDNPDLLNDVDGATGVVDSSGLTADTATETGAQILVDTGLTAGTYTGAIVRITSGTASGEERIILDQTTTGIVVTTNFTTAPDSTSNYSIGDIISSYSTKHYDMGDAPRKKGFKELFLWTTQAANNEVKVSFGLDFEANTGSETKNLAPASVAVWDTAIWDTATWDAAADTFVKVKLKGAGRFMNFDFENDNIDSTFHLYGYNIVGERLDVR